MGSIIWDTEEVGSENDWKSLIKARIQAREEKEWLEEMTQLPKLRTYRKLKLVFKKEEYLMTITDREERRRMTALEHTPCASRLADGEENCYRIEHAHYVRRARLRTKSMHYYIVLPTREKEASCLGVF